MSFTSAIVAFALKLSASIEALALRARGSCRKLGQTWTPPRRSLYALIRNQPSRLKRHKLDLKEFEPSAVSGRTETPVSNFVQLTMNGQVGTAISRADLADFILKQVVDKNYLRKAPAIGN